MKILRERGGLMDDSRMRGGVVWGAAPLSLRLNSPGVFCGTMKGGLSGGASDATTHSVYAGVLRRM